MKPARQDVLDVLAKHHKVLRALGVQSLALFGSAARDETSATSDLDFVVELSPKTFNSYMDVKFYLEEVFGVPVDLVLSDTIKPVLRDTILGEAVHAEGF